MIVRKPVSKLDHYFNSNLPRYWELKPSQKREIKKETVSYIFKMKPAYEYRKFLKDATGCNHSSIKVQKGLLSNGFIMKDLKLFIVQKMAETKPIDVGLDKSIMKVLDDIQLKHLSKISKEAPTTKHELDTLIMKCIEESKAMATKLIYKKLSFIIRHTEVSFEDIKDHVILESIQNLLFVYPNFKSELHAINTTKTIMRNTAKNYIESFTRKKVNPFEDGMLRVGGLSGSNKDGEDYEIHIPSSDFTADQNRIDFFKLCSKYKGKKRLCLQLLSGIYDRGFSDWLKHEKGLSMDNDAYFEKVEFQYYVKMCSNYLNVCEYHVNNFVLELQQRFSNYKEY